MPGVLADGGNPIAESIIDDYFPASVSNPRHPTASFDFPAVCRMLQSGTVAKVTLPVLGPGWAHLRCMIPATLVDQAVIDRLQQYRLRHGIHAQFLQSDTGDMIVDGVAPQEHHAVFRAAAGV
jgi:hypothetical protein